METFISGNAIGVIAKSILLNFKGIYHDPNYFWVSGSYFVLCYYHKNNIFRNLTYWVIVYFPLLRYDSHTYFKQITLKPINKNLKRSF